MKKVIISFFCLALFASIFLFFAGCSDDEPISDNTYVNNWILREMKTYYYWNEEIPVRTNKSLNPNDYFESLLSNQDRFSWIQPNFQELLDALGGITKEAGYEFVLYLESEGSSNVIAQIVYVKPNSPASEAGLQRGYVIRQINGQSITVDNFRNLLGQTSENHTITYYTNYQGPGSTGPSQEIALQPIVYAENPHFLSTIIEQNGAKIGYYVMNFFAQGANGSYNSQMDQIIESFVTEGITDLVLDFRFNGGGSEFSAVNLASLIGKNVDNTKIFSKREYNSLVTDAILRDASLGQSFLEVKFVNKSTKLNLDRIYILTSGRTASASELIINGLLPYMDVILIGTTTVGKNVGSITIYEDNDPRNNWGMQPIVVKLLNSENQANYENGFTPNVEVRDNSITLEPLGSTTEPLLAEAIRQITGTDPGSGERRVTATSRFGASLGSSVEYKKRNHLLNMDQLKKELKEAGATEILKIHQQ